MRADLFFPKRLLAPVTFCVALSPFFLAGCSQTTSHAMSVSALTDAITPSIFSARPLRPTMRDRECLARAMFFESNRSSRDGMIAVGTVVMNRLKSGEHGNTICAVVGEPQQFAPGVLTRKMNSRALPDVMEAADAVLRGERSPKLRNTMYFHTAGLHFPYRNMHYTLVAGGNAFYEKRDRHFRELPPDSMFAFGGTTPGAAPQQQTVMVASADPVQRTLTPQAPAAIPAEALVPPDDDSQAVRTASTAQDNSLFSTSKRQHRQSVVPAPVAPVEVAQADEPIQPGFTDNKHRNRPTEGLEQSLPANSPFMMASQEPPPAGTFARADEPVQPATRKKKRTTSSSTASYQAAYAEPSSNPALAIMDPDNAPVPTARAGFVAASADAEPQPIHKTRRMKAVAVKPPKAMVEMASDESAEQPSAARFGRDGDSGGDQPTLSFNQ